MPAGEPRSSRPRLDERSGGDARPPERLTIGGLVIRRWRSEDLDALQRAVAESIEALRPWLAWANDDPSSQREFLEASAQAWKGGDRFEYAIEGLDEELVGSVGLMRRIGPGGLEIGYWVHSRHSGRGIAKLATAALTDAAFGLLAWVDHVEIHHDQLNLASRAVPEGLGFRIVESVEKVPMALSESGVDLIWRLGRADYPASPARALLARSGARGG